MKAKPTVTQILQQRRQKFQKGGAFSWKDPGTGSALRSAGSLGSSLVGMVDPGDENGVQSDVGAGLSGALSGAAAGAALGPVGAGVGALIGGVSSFLGNSAAEEQAKKAKERKRNLDQAKAMQDSQNILSNYDNMGTGLKSLKDGGTVWSWPGGYSIEPFKFTPNKNTFSSDAGLSFQEGGQIPAGNGNLKPIGDSESFEVKGHDPDATDDVILGDAAVDHDEVVKPGPEGLRIFSDTLKPPGSKLPFSKLAKQLEKQKTKDEQRFPQQNKKIEEKLEHLFQTQQAMNGDSNGESTEEGMVPEGEEKGEGFNQGNMFEAGGRLYPIVTGDHKMPGISFQPKAKGFRTYHDITPSDIGAFRPVGFGSAVMAKAGNRVSAEAIYRQNAPHIIKGRYKQGGNLMMNFKRPSYETAAEGLFEQPPGYKAELAVEPGHGEGAATFKSGGIHIKPSHAGRFTAYKQRTGKTTEQALHSSDPHVRKMAQFAKNASKWKHQEGGIATPDQVPDLSKFTGVEMFPGSTGTINHAIKSGIFKSGTSFENIPESFKQLKSRGKAGEVIRGYDYVDIPEQHVTSSTGTSVAGPRGQNLAINKQVDTGVIDPNLIRAVGGETEDTFPEFPGRRVTKLYYGQPETQQAVSSATAAPIPGRKLPQPNWSSMMINGKAHGKFQGGGAYNKYDAETGQDSVEQVGNNTATADPKKKGLNINLGKPDWSNVLSTGATLAPVLANMQAARNLPAVPEVFLNKSVNLKRNSYADQQNMLQQGLRTASLAARQNSVNPNAQQAGIGNAQAQYMGATNQMFGDINRSNNDIQRQEAMINAQISGANNQLLGQRSQSETARQANLLGLQSKNRGDLSNKILGLTQQENLKGLDKQKYAMFMAWLNKQGEGLGDRNAWMKPEGFKMGGVIQSTRKLRKKAC